MKKKDMERKINLLDEKFDVLFDLGTRRLTALREMMEKLFGFTKQLEADMTVLRCKIENPNGSVVGKQYGYGGKVYDIPSMNDWERVELYRKKGRWVQFDVTEPTRTAKDGRIITCLLTNDSLEQAQMGADFVGSEWVSVKNRY